MQPGIPKSAEVDRAFRQLAKRLQTTRRRIDQQAAKQMRHGDYTEAERWMKVGQSVAEYGSRVDAFLAEWKALVGSYKSPRSEVRKGGAKPGVTPVWKFYQPILNALATLGGVGTREQIEPLVRDTMHGAFGPKDLAPTSKSGAVRWQKSVARAKRPMIREGWIEIQQKEWRLTEKGRTSLRSGGNSGENTADESRPARA